LAKLALLLDNVELVVCYWRSVDSAVKELGRLVLLQFTKQWQTLWIAVGYDTATEWAVISLGDFVDKSTVTDIKI
jgi:hypothetical protein